MERNLLIDALPGAVMVGGKRCAIRTDFRVGLLFEMLMFSSLSDAQKVRQALLLYYPEGIPEPTDDAYRAILRFYRGGEREEGARGGACKRVFDCRKDAALLFSAFYDQYGIDLQEIEGLHWWKFRALFRGLREEHPIARIMAIRAADLSKAQTREERARLLRLKDRYRIEDRVSAAEVKRSAGAIFAGKEG